MQYHTHEGWACEMVRWEYEVSMSMSMNYKYHTFVQTLHSIRYFLASDEYMFTISISRLTALWIWHASILSKLDRAYQDGLSYQYIHQNGRNRRHPPKSDVTCWNCRKLDELFCLRYSCSSGLSSSPNFLNAVRISTIICVEISLPSFPTFSSLCTWVTWKVKYT